MTGDVPELWPASELVPAVHGALMAPIGLPIEGISIDSRSVQPGDVFVALEGPSRDGHAFVADALAAGAAAAIVTHEPADALARAPLVRVDDTLLALDRLGDHARRRTHAKIIAVTGSVGKTGTKEMLAHVLAAQGPTHKSAASYNNHWGVPLSLARLPRQARYAVLELGMNHAGEIASLARLARPDIAIITTVEPAHLEFFPNVEAIADAKAEIFLGMTGAGTAILNLDNSQYGRLERAAKDRGVHTIIRFGVADEADIRLVALATDSGGTAVTATFHGAEYRYRLAQPGRHIAMNSLAVLAAVHAAGGDIEQAAAALETIEPMAGRGLWQTIQVEGGTATLIDESYNASPAAMRAALSVLGHAGGRRIAVLGDMRELGKTGPDLHRALVEDVAAAQVSALFCSGDLMGTLAAAANDLGIAAVHAESAAALLPFVEAGLRPGDFVLVKGSLGSRMADIVRPLLARREEGSTGQC